MATLTENLPVASAAGHLRPFSARRDLSAVADLIEIGFADTLDEDGRRYLQQMRQSAQRMNSFGWGGFSGYMTGASMSGYVWEEDGRVVGNLSLIPYMLGLQRYFLIANVVALPEYRRRGIGRQLTLRGIEHARQAGVPAVWLHVREENAGAVALYESLGFVERARRATWYSHGEGPRPETPAGMQILTCRSSHWAMQRQWLQLNYPAELTWHLPIRTNYLRPGLLGALFRSFTDFSIYQWAVVQNGSLQATLSWQSGNLATGVLWLAAPSGADETAIKALLQHARRNTPTRKSLMLDYPAGQSELAIEAAEFKKHQTLIWMSVTF